MSCSTPEPAPTRFYAPAGLFPESQLAQVEYLGDRIFSPGKNFFYQVASGPLCRLHWNGTKLEPHSFESAYYQLGESPQCLREGTSRKAATRRWKRSHSNYLSYLLIDGSYLTVRWEPPCSKLE